MKYYFTNLILVVILICSVVAQGAIVDNEFNARIEQQFEVLMSEVRAKLAGSRDTTQLRELLQSVSEAAHQVEDERLNRLMHGSIGGQVFTSLPASTATAVDKIMVAVGDNNASVLSIYYAMRMFEQINNDSIPVEGDSIDPVSRHALYVKQADYVYEVSTVVLEVLAQTELAGLESLRDMKDDRHSAILRRLAAINLQRSRLQEDVESGKLTQSNARRMESSYVQIIGANQALTDAWSKLQKSTDAQSGFMDSLPSFISQVQQKQQLAKFQLDTLRDVVLIGREFDPLEPVEDISSQLAVLPLLELDRSVVLQLVSGPGGVSVSK